MHFVVSMSFATVMVPGARIHGSGNVVPGRPRMSSDCRAIARSLRLFEPGEGGLAARSLTVGITDERRQRIGEEAGFGESHEPPMERSADVVQRLTLDPQR